MQELFSALTRAVEGQAALALAAAFVWGVLSILLSPCHLASIPLLVAFIDAQGRASLRRAFLVALLFALGILATIALLAGITAAAGRMLGDAGAWANYVVALFLFAAGLHLVGVLPAPWSGPGQLTWKRRGLLAAFLMGLVFGIALGPCAFAFMAAPLAVALKIARTQAPYAVALLLAYGSGHCLVFVLAGTFTSTVQRYLNWDEASRGATALRRVCGVLVMMGGLYLLYTAR